MFFIYFNLLKREIRLFYDSINNNLEVIEEIYFLSIIMLVIFYSVYTYFSLSACAYKLLPPCLSPKKQKKIASTFAISEEFLIKHF